MSNEKFTPGEWEVKSINTHWETTGTIYSTLVIAPSAGYIISSIDTKDEKLLKMIQANAHLIAAAPEMYRMLGKIIEFQKDNLGDGIKTHLGLIDLAKQIDAVLKKARGEE